MHAYNLQSISTARNNHALQTWQGMQTSHNCGHTQKKQCKSRTLHKAILFRACHNAKRG